MKSAHEIDLWDDPESLVPLKEAGAYVPPKGVSTATMFRWSSKGSRGVVLKTVKVARNLMTSRAAVIEFLRRVDAVRNAEATIEDVDRDQLVAAGLLTASK